MRLRELKRKIALRKFLLNTLLIFLNPTNTIIVQLSQDLDIFITKYQKYSYTKHKKKEAYYITRKKIA
ncbi:hypothetical protein SAMN02745163_00939 [Clostridium cavendishii DSM 21758]|uniref:Spo0E like sporulation regulatory protein n=1 Tax=Clostridium cavendishii DSM 21758 TaxID=1121302 RepID=A0A1M6ETM3_9CLOT|nr:Spo0E family sporulation regulatory protein-aspartic acid phosphatase [Clostridium cavendishii]SHI88710.1 hypothetical protein SAMN02745163_00939 [Clostridium cavendishii DSM 21758]